MNLPVAVPASMRGCAACGVNAVATMGMDGAVRRVMITGGAGFIGSHVVRRFVEHYPNYEVVNVDALTYAGHPENVSDLVGRPNYTFYREDVCNLPAMQAIMGRHAIDTVIHLAAESHVDRSIADPLHFARVNVLGTLSLLEAARLQWSNAMGGKLFYQVSTDEVYGALGHEGYFTETMPYSPKSPYSSSKASADHFVRAYGNTFGLPYVVSCCSNNYGPNQHPEKLIPLCIRNILHREALPIYGQGTNVRDWLYVLDHAAAIDTIVHWGRTGETYNVGGHQERDNLSLVRALCRIMDRKLGRDEGESERLITFVPDRLGHDFRYAIDSSKLCGELRWAPSVTLEQGLELTVDWYLGHQDWLEQVMQPA